MSKRVLVTDGEQRAALAVVRSLGHRGHTVHVSSSHPQPIAKASKYCSGFRATTDPLRNPAEYVDQLIELCRIWRIEVLLPITEASLMAILPQAARFSGVQIPGPSCDAFMAVSDKAELMRTAPRFGLNVPQQLEVPAPEAFDAASLAELRFPLVIKPARSVGVARDERIANSVQYATDKTQLRKVLRALPKAAFPVLLQQRVSGRGVGIPVLLWNGTVQALFSHRRIREKPPSGGVSVYSESIAPDPALAAGVVELLQHYRWSGVAMAEFKQDLVSGTAWLMEINGRFWGSLQLAIDAGVDFPALLLDCVEWGSAHSGEGYRAGVQLRWWWGDFDQLLMRIRKSRSMLNLPAGFPGRAIALREFMTLWRPGDRSEVLRRVDPRPGFVETVNWFRRR